jgi:HJR/Mrr/RecB family endonuclease
MADCRRVFEAVSSGTPKHLTVLYYEQIENTKNVRTITEVDLTDSRDLLFGTLTRSQIEELVEVVKSVPKGRAPNPQEKNKIDSLRDSLQKLSGAILLNIKIDSKKQRRLQCSFNNFPQFLKKNPERIVATSNTNEFRGGTISSQIISGPRVFNENQIV